MRNIFDQYKQPENRITHAFATCLYEDRELLHGFIKWIIKKAPPKSSAIEILEQRIPGELEISEEESEGRGLPDIWIHNNDGWALLVESKISATLSIEQLERHYKTACNRGFQDTQVLAIEARPQSHQLPEWAHHIQCKDIYVWLVGESKKSQWAKKVADYLEIAESRFIEDEYMKEGTLTVFSGVPFGDDAPYSYLEAKRVLRLAMDELRKYDKLTKELGVLEKGRKAITGEGELSVWDFLKLKSHDERKDLKEFTEHPHLTLGVEHDRIHASITIPYKIKSKFRKNIISNGLLGFKKLMEDINNNLLGVLPESQGVAPWVIVLQRHYPSQKSAAILDALLQYDLRTAFEPVGNSSEVKFQPEWLDTTYNALKNKKSNLQVAVGATFSYRHCKLTKKPEILDCIANTWLACKSLLDPKFNTQI